MSNVVIKTIYEVKCYACRIPAGSIGTIIGKNQTGNPLVEFEKNIGGHGGVKNEEGKNGHCWWIWPSNLKIERVE